jgi:transcriptional regulator with XRE-family HTH domain
MIEISDKKALPSNRLKEIRKAAGLTQSQLAELCDMSLVMLQYIEGGQRQLTPKWMQVFAKALNIEPWMLIADPKTVFDPRDREIISRYHALPTHLRAIVDAVLFAPPTSSAGEDSKK